MINLFGEYPTHLGVDYGCDETFAVTYIEPCPDYTPAYKNGISYSPRSGLKVILSTPWFPTAEQAADYLKSEMIKYEYKLPRWYQWWRWGENVPEFAKTRPEFI